MEALRRALLCAVYILVFACFNNSVNSSALDVPCNPPCLLVAATTEIIALDYNNGTIYPIISNLSYAEAIDYHYSLGYIFWSDNGGRNIKRSNINGTDIKVLHNDIGNCRGLAVDWRSSKLLWTVSFISNGTISVSDLDGNNKRVLLSSLDYPRGIVLDPERGLIFWAEGYGEVKKSTLNGLRNFTLVMSLIRPVGIDLDRQNKLVFWVDGSLKTVGYVDYDGNNRKLLYQGSSYHLWRATFFSSYLFVFASSSGTPVALKLNASNEAFISSVSLPGLGTPYGLVTYDRSRQLTGCPSLPAPSNGTRLGCPGNTTVYYDTVCQFSCNNGYIGSGSQLRRCQDNGTWSGQDFTCQIINCTSLMVDPEGPLRMSSCANHYGAKCNFSCSIGYRLNGPSTVTCVASGNQHPGVWNNTIPTCQDESSTKVPVESEKTKTVIIIVVVVIAVVIVIGIVGYCCCTHEYSANCQTAVGPAAQ